MVYFFKQIDMKKNKNCNLIIFNKIIIQKIWIKRKQFEAQNLGKLDLVDWWLQESVYIG